MTAIDRFTAATSSPDLVPAFRDALQARWGEGVNIAALEVTRVFPRRDGGASIHYAAQARENESRRWSSLALAAHMVAPGQDVVESTDRDAFAIEELGMTVYAFPFDPVLHRLADLASPETIPTVLESLEWIEGPVPRSARVIQSSVLGYRLEKRCVFRVLVDQSRSDGPRAVRELVVKVALPRAARRAHAGLDHLRKAGLPDRWTARWPTSLAVDPDRGVRVMEFIAAPPIHNMFSSGPLVEACESAANALADLHEVDGHGLKERHLDDELESVRLAVACASWARPEWRGHLIDSMELAAERLRALAPERSCCIHGDYYDKQVLYQDGETVVLDLDGLVSGDPGQDVGNFDAHLRLRALQHPECANRIARARQRFVNSYASRNPRAALRRGAWESMSLVRLAALYSLRPQWRQLTAPLLYMAAGKEITNP